MLKNAFIRKGAALSWTHAYRRGKSQNDRIRKIYIRGNSHKMLLILLNFEGNLVTVDFTAGKTLTSKISGDRLRQVFGRYTHRVSRKVAVISKSKNVCLSAATEK